MCFDILLETALGGASARPYAWRMFLKMLPQFRRSLFPLLVQYKCVLWVLTTPLVACISLPRQWAVSVLQSLCGVACARRPPAMSDDVSTTLPWWRHLRRTSGDHLQPIRVLRRQSGRLLRRHNDVRLWRHSAASTWRQVWWNVPRVSTDQSLLTSDN